MPRLADIPVNTPLMHLPGEGAQSRTASGQRSLVAASVALEQLARRLADDVMFGQAAKRAAKSFSQHAVFTASAHRALVPKLDKNSGIDRRC